MSLTKTLTFDYHLSISFYRYYLITESALKSQMWHLFWDGWRYLWFDGSQCFSQIDKVKQTQAFDSVNDYDCGRLNEVGLELCKSIWPKQVNGV